MRKFAVGAAMVAIAGSMLFAAASPASALPIDTPKAAYEADMKGHLDIIKNGYGTTPEYVEFREFGETYPTKLIPYKSASYFPKTGALNLVQNNGVNVKCVSKAKCWVQTHAGLGGDGKWHPLAPGAVKVKRSDSVLPYTKAMSAPGFRTQFTRDPKSNNTLILDEFKVVGQEAQSGKTVRVTTQFGIYSPSDRIKSAISQTNLYAGNASYFIADVVFSDAVEAVKAPAASTIGAPDNKTKVSFTVL